MIDSLLRELLEARANRRACSLVTLVEARGSTPRAAGAKMLVYADGTLSGTIGGGKFEALVIAECGRALAERRPILQTYPLHEHDPASFGAICGGTVTVLIEPQLWTEMIYLIGGGHCAQAIARMARDCGWRATIFDERAELLCAEPGIVAREENAAEFLATHAWQPDEALVLVNRNYHLDREALALALRHRGWGYCGMIGSGRKVQRVYAELRERGFSDADFAAVHAPIGLDLGAESPAEIAVSVLAEIMRVLRGASGTSLRAIHPAPLNVDAD